MRFKLDENLGPSAADVLTQQGHDVTTVPAHVSAGARTAGCLKPVAPKAAAW